jgi:hypothetical protein
MATVSGIQALASNDKDESIVLDRFMRLIGSVFKHVSRYAHVGECHIIANSAVKQKTLRSVSGTIQLAQHPIINDKQFLINHKMLVCSGSVLLALHNRAFRIIYLSIGVCFSSPNYAASASALTLNEGLTATPTVIGERLCDSLR